MYVFFPLHGHFGMLLTNDQLWPGISPATPISLALDDISLIVGPSLGALLSDMSPYSSASARLFQYTAPALPYLPGKMSQMPPRFQVHSDIRSTCFMPRRSLLISSCRSIHLPTSTQ